VPVTCKLSAVPFCRVSVLHVDCKGCEWEVFNQLYVKGSALLSCVDTLLLALHPGSLHHPHHVYTLYQHLYQENGFTGYHHQGAVNQSAWGHGRHAAAAGGRRAGNETAQGANAEVVVGLVRTTGLRQPGERACYKHPVV
jgi:hypothetical protein